MNLEHFGDSYDFVKRFFCRELSALGYAVDAEPYFCDVSGANAIKDYYLLLGVQPVASPRRSAKRTALFLDPDIGINNKGGAHHVSLNQLVKESRSVDLVFAFDQSFSRAKRADEIIFDKLEKINNHKCFGMYYNNTHARFVFVATRAATLFELKRHLLTLGIPKSRLIQQKRNSSC